MTEALLILIGGCYPSRSADHEDQMADSLAQPEHPDTLIRFPSASTGADQDVAIACERGLPVWCRIEDIPGYQPHHEPGLVREDPA